MKREEEEGISAEDHPITPVAIDVMVDKFCVAFRAGVIDEPAFGDTFEVDGVGVDMAEEAIHARMGADRLDFVSSRIRQ